jgi:hypothetical protein
MQCNRSYNITPQCIQPQHCMALRLNPQEPPPPGLHFPCHDLWGCARGEKAAHAHGSALALLRYPSEWLGAPFFCRLAWNPAVGAGPKKSVLSRSDLVPHARAGGGEGGGGALTAANRCGIRGS